MRPNALPTLRHLRNAPSCLLKLQSPLCTSRQQPTTHSIRTFTKVASPTPKPNKTYPKKFPVKATSAGAVRGPPMTVDQVDTTLDPLPELPVQQKPKPATAPPDDDFATALQMTSPAYTISPNEAVNGNGNGNGNGSSDTSVNWSSSFHGLSTTAFDPTIAAVLMAPVDPDDIEIKPDGIAYYPEIKYRRILNQAFGPGAWGLAPRGELVVGEKVVTREYALVVHGRFVAQARGECQYFSEDTIPTATEGCKSNALTRCCKDLGIASELWDPRFLRAFKKEHCRQVWVEHVVSKSKRQIWTRKDVEPQYPYQAVKR